MSEEKWIPNKFEKEEQICIEKFISFSKLAIMKKYFVITAETQYGTMCDTVSINKTGGTVVAELKYRDKKATGYTDCYIEISKYENLLKLYEKGCLPLYLNFIGDKYYLWVIPTICSGLKKYKKVHIKSSISGMKYVDRYGLKWQDAWIFDKEGNIIQESKCIEAPDPPKKHNINFNKAINNKVLNNLK